MNPFYDHMTPPASGSRGTSSTMRNEFDAVEHGFDLAFGYMVDTGTANAMVVSPPAALTVLNSTNDGLVFRIKAANTVTGATTVNFGATLGTKSLRMQDGTALSNQIIANQTFECVWDSAAEYLKLMTAGVPVASNGLPLTGGTMTGAINEARGADIASASSINLKVATGNNLHLTGAATVNTITLSVGARRTLIIDSTPTFANSASLLCITGANVVGAAGDVVEFIGESGGVVRMTDYTRADGTSLASGINSVTNITTATTLTSANLAEHAVAMTAIGQSVTLPSGLTMKVGGPKAIFRNTGGYPFGILDNTGALLMAVAPGGVAYVSCESISSQAGAWAITGTNLEPGLITIDSTFSSTYSSNVLAPFVALDDKTSIHFAALTAGGFAAFIVDDNAPNPMTPITVSAVAGDVPKIAFKVTATSAIVFYGTGSGAATKAVVLTVSGTSPSLSLAVGASATSSLFDGADENFVGAPRIAQLSPTLYVASSKDTSSTSAYVTAISVSGAAVTWGVYANLPTASVVNGSTTTYALTATTALVLYKSGAAAPYVNNAVVISVSGVTSTVNTPVASLTSTLTAVPSSCLLSATKCLLQDDAGTTGNVVAAAITVSGVTVSAGVGSTVETSIATSSSFAANSATRYNAHLFALSTTTALLWYLDSSGISRVVVLTESGGTVTAGAILYRSISGAGPSTSDGGLLYGMGTTEFVALKQESAATSAFRTRAVPHKISSAAITAGATCPLVELPFGALAGSAQFVVSRLSSGDYLVFGANPITGGVCAISVFRSNGDFIAYRGKINVPVLLTTLAAAYPGVASNRIVSLGSTQTEGTIAGPSLYQLRLLNIKVAA